MYVCIEVVGSTIIAVLNYELNWCHSYCKTNVWPYW